MIYNNAIYNMMTKNTTFLREGIVYFKHYQIKKSFEAICMCIKKKVLQEIHFSVYAVDTIFLTFYEAKP